MQRKQILFHLIRIFAGTVFILSALFKFLSIDLFELYIFGQHIFNFNGSAIAARLIICTEFFIGIMLITGLYFKIIYRFTFLLLILFSVFLIVQIIKGKTDENCHCFGELIKLTPLESLFKNIALVVILFIIRKNENVSIAMEKYIALFIFLLSFTVPVILSAPDFIFQFDREKPDFKKTSALIKSNEQLINAGVTNGKKLVCFFSVTCPYCEMASTKISIIATNHHLEDQTIYVFAGDKEDLPAFLEKGGSANFNSFFLDIRTFFNIAGPIVPSVYLINDGTVIQQFNYRDIDENEIIRFLAK